MSELHVSKLGRIELIARGESYICTHLAYKMSINDVPRASVTVVGGRSVRTPGKHSQPEDLLKALDRNNGGLIQCSIKEVIDGESDKVIFKGYLLDGGLSYNAEGVGTSNVYFNCAGYAAALMLSPGSAYVEASVGAVVNDVVWRADTDGIESVLSQNNEYMYTQVECMQATYDATMYLPIVQRLAVLVTGARAAGSTAGMYDFMEKLTNGGDVTEVMDKDVLRAFGGKTNLKHDSLPFGCPELYSNELINNIVRTMAGSNIYDAIFNGLTSPHFSLELAPRWSCDDKNDFKTEIKPISAWRPRHVISLDAGEIVRFTATKNALAKASTPDILLTIFSDPMVSDDPAASETELYSIAGARGVAAKSKELNQRLRAWTTTGALPMNMSAIGKVQQMNMPRWCAMIPATSDAVNADDLVRQQTLANDIATVMLQYYYKANDTAQISLPLSMRFGHGKHHLENMLGERVKVTLSKNADRESRDIRAYGCLASIYYEYNATQAGRTNASYTIGLNRVGFGDPDNELLDMESPIYTY